MKGILGRPDCRPECSSELPNTDDGGGPAGVNDAEVCAVGGGPAGVVEGCAVLARREFGVLGGVESGTANMMY